MGIKCVRFIRLIKVAVGYSIRNVLIQLLKSDLNHFVVIKILLPSYDTSTIDTRFKNIAFFSIHYY